MKFMRSDEEIQSIREPEVAATVLQQLVDVVEGMTTLILINSAAKLSKSWGRKCVF